jgi:hypothetical protein
MQLRFQRGPSELLPVDVQVGVGGMGDGVAKRLIGVGTTVRARHGRFRFSRMSARPVTAPRLLSVRRARAEPGGGSCSACTMSPLSSHDELSGGGDGHLDVLGGAR